jgi:hypothetical protein
MGQQASQQLKVARTGLENRDDRLRQQDAHELQSLEHDAEVCSRTSILSGSRVFAGAIRLAPK